MAGPDGGGWKNLYKEISNAGVFSIEPGASDTHVTLMENLNKSLRVLDKLLLTASIKIEAVDHVDIPAVTEKKNDACPTPADQNRDRSRSPRKDKNLASGDAPLRLHLDRPDFGLITKPDFDEKEFDAAIRSYYDATCMIFNILILILIWTLNRLVGLRWNPKQNKLYKNQVKCQVYTKVCIFSLEIGGCNKLH